MAYSTSDIITWAKAAQPLAAHGEAKKAAQQGGAIDIDLHRKIYIERKSLEWQYAQDPTDDDGILFEQGNYVYALLFPYLFAAQEATGGGGQVVNPTTSGAPDQLNFTVAASGTTLIDGQSSVTLSDFIGFNLIVNKNGTALTQISTAPVYYTWDENSGSLTVVPAAFLGDEFQITAV